MVATGKKTPKSAMLEVFISVIKIAAVSYVGLCILVYFTQSRYVYYPEKQIFGTPSQMQLEYEDISLETEDGETIAAWYVPAGPDPTQGLTLLFCHGNGGNISHRLGSILTFNQLGMHVLIFDYHGYGASTGRPGEEETYLDVQACWKHLVETRGVPPSQIVLFGRSLGGAVAAWLATQVSPHALVLESSFTSIPDMGSSVFSFLPVRWLCRFKYNTLARLSSIGCPVLVAHGTGDRTVPYAHGQKLFDAASEPKHFIEFTGEHNDGGMDAEPEHRKAFMEFLNAYDPGHATAAEEEGP